MIDADWSKGDCTRTTNPKLEGAMIADLARAYGPPSADHKFAMGQESNPFNIGLRNIYPLPANKDRIIREVEWSRGLCRLTVWSVAAPPDWRAVLAMRWDSRTDF